MLLGTDTISISSMMHCDMGRSAHRGFLNVGIRIFEDMALVNAKQINLVVAMPLSLADFDGAPCPAIGILHRLFTG